MTDELERRLMEALDAQTRPADDPALADALTDPSFARRAAEFESLDGWLREWETPAPSEAEFDAIARRIEQRLGESFDDTDFTQPPVFEDADARVRTLKGSVSSGSYSLSALTPPTAPAAGVTGPGPAVVLGEKRRASRVPVFLAAAAVVGLAVTAGVATMGSSEEPMMASAEMAAEAVSAAPASAPSQSLEGPVEWAEEEGQPLDPSEEPMAEPVAAEPEMDQGYALADGALVDTPGSSPEGARRARPRAVPADDSTVSGRGGSALGNDAFGGAPAGSAMATKAGGAAPPAATGSASDREASTGGETSLEDRLRACAGSSVPGRVSLRLTVAERRVTAVQVRSPSSLASQSACFVRALRDERFDGGPTLERTYRLR